MPISPTTSHDTLKSPDCSQPPADQMPAQTSVESLWCLGDLSAMRYNSAPTPPPPTSSSVYRGLNPRPKAKGKIRAGLLASLIVHLLGTIALLSERFNQELLPNSGFEIEMISPKEWNALQEKPQSKQVVTTSDKAKNEAPKTPTKLSAEKDSSVKTEQIKRGDTTIQRKETAQQNDTNNPRPAPTTKLVTTALSNKNAPQPKNKQQQSTTPKKPAQAKSTATQQRTPGSAPSTVKAKAPKKLDLSPALGSLRIAEQSANAASSESPVKKNLSGWQTPSVQPFSRPAGANAQFHGRLGQSDYLPGIKDGDVTLLNAKADKYAVFVRRVALRVFESIKSKGWQYLSASDIRGITNYGTIRAVLTTKGVLKKVIIESPSGSTRFDVMLNQAVSTSVSDPHPPADAAAQDGNIHFIFMARTWSEVYQNPRNPGIGERRWLILKAGLD